MCRGCDLRSFIAVQNRRWGAKSYLIMVEQMYQAGLGILAEAGLKVGFASHELCPRGEKRA